MMRSDDLLRPIDMSGSPRLPGKTLYLAGEYLRLTRDAALMSRTTFRFFKAFAGKASGPPCPAGRRQSHEPVGRVVPAFSPCDFCRACARKRSIFNEVCSNGGCEQINSGAGTTGREEADR